MQSYSISHLTQKWETSMRGKWRRRTDFHMLGPRNAWVCFSAGFGKDLGKIYSLFYWNYNSLPNLKTSQCLTLFTSERDWIVCADSKLQPFPLCQLTQSSLWSTASYGSPWRKPIHASIGEVQRFSAGRNSHLLWFLMLKWSSGHSEIASPPPSLLPHSLLPSDLFF